MLFLRRRLVRLHLVDPFPSVQGILSSSFDGHYRLLKPELLRGESQTEQLSGDLYVPRERVIFLQRL